MAFDLTIKFFSVRLRLISGGFLLMPVLDSNTLRINMLPEILAGKYADKFQKTVISKGNILSILNEYNGGDFYKSQIQVAFKAAKDKTRFPAFELEFDYFYKATLNGFWATVPALGIESYGENELDLEDMLRDAIRLEFSRNRRLSAVQHIVAAIWFDTIELQSHDMGFQIPSLKDIEDQSEQLEESLLSRVGVKLNIQSPQVYFRDKELQHFERALKASFNKSVLLVGPSGVGKTALVWEMSRLFESYGLEGEVWETTASNMIKELTGDTGWQDNLSFLCRELANSSDYLFIRNLLELFEVGQYVGNEMSVAEYLRPFISRGDVTLIAECTEEELARIEIRSPNFISFFQIIRLEEPTKDLEKIIINKIIDLAKGRQLNVDLEAIKETLRLHRRFSPYSGMPGRPIRFLESILINQLNKNVQIDRSIIIKNFCEESGMPVFMVDPEIPMNPDQVKQDFNQNLFGQTQAVEGIVNLLASVKTALTRTGKPIASFLFVGPTGVGKTEMAKLLSNFMFGSRDRMIRFDMSEFSDPYSVLRLTGENYFSDGLLTGAVRREPFCVLLFDEIEKAYPSFYDLLLQILSEGRLTDNKGQLVNLCSTIIIMTSNIGATNLQSNRISINSEQTNEDVTGHFMSAVQKHFRPELFNRIDQVIPFEPLSRDIVRLVVDREIALLRKREGIRYRTMNLMIDDQVLDYLSEVGYNSKYGARYLQRCIREKLGIPLSKKLNQVDYTDQLEVQVSILNYQVDIQVEADPLGIDLMLEELEKINQTDLVSELRRKIGRLKEGHFFIRILSRLDLLERDKKKRKERFWNDEKKSKEYSYLLKIKNDVEMMIDQINYLEEQYALVCMDVQPFDPQINKEVEQWKKDYFKLKMEIYYHLHPDANTCFMAIYGALPQQVLAFYEKILTHKAYEYAIETIWFRESYYNGEVRTKEKITDAEGNEVEVVTKKRRQAYLKVKSSNDDPKNYAPPKDGDVLVGLELKINGPCVHLYFERETGIHQWKTSPKEAFNHRVHIAGKSFDTPHNIHRKDFFKGTPRRIIEPTHVKDTTLNINRDVGRKKQTEPFIEALDTLFLNRLDQALM